FAYARFGHTSSSTGAAVTDPALRDRMAHLKSPVVRLQTPSAPVAPTAPQVPPSGRTASGFVPRSLQAPHVTPVPPPPALPENLASISGPVSFPISPLPQAHAFASPIPDLSNGAEERPVPKSIHTVRQLIETVAIPRVSLTLEREGGMPVQRTIVHD